MFDYLKKSLLTGIGLALRSKNEIEDLAKEFAKKSEMSQDEAKDFLKECQQKYEDAKTGFDKKIEEAIEKILLKLDLPSKSDIKALNDRIDD
ncbi:MAG: phasin family protein, partial [Desulfobacula sp.]|nr:phasin family protein [Desulfobacula sp.]